MVGKPFNLLAMDQGSVSGNGIAASADGQAGRHILVAELGEVCQQLGFSAAARQSAEDIADGEPGASGARLAKANGRIDDDALKKIHWAMIGVARCFRPTPVTNRLVRGEQAALDQIQLQFAPRAASHAVNLRAS